MESWRGWRLTLRTSGQHAASAPRSTRARPIAWLFLQAHTEVGRCSYLSHFSTGLPVTASHMLPSARCISARNQKSQADRLALCGPIRERRAWNPRRLRDFWAENGLSPLRRNHLQFQASGVGWEKTRQWLSIFAHSLKNNAKRHVRLLAKPLYDLSARDLRESTSPITR